MYATTALSYRSVLLQLIFTFQVQDISGIPQETPVPHAKSGEGLDSTVKELVKGLVSALEQKSLADQERLALELHVGESARQHEKERQELEAQIQGLERSIQEREQTITELQVRYKCA